MRVNVEEVIAEKMAFPGALWESPGSQLDRPQPHPERVCQEEAGKEEPPRPHYELLCVPKEDPQPLQEAGHQPELLCDIKEEPLEMGNKSLLHPPPLLHICAWPGPTGP